MTGVGKPVLRVGKIKKAGRTNPRSVQNHLERSRPTPNADPGRTAGNRWLVAPKDGDLRSAIEDVHARAGVTPRKDSVIANDLILSVSPEWFRPSNPEAVGTWDADRLATFETEATAFLRETFGNRLVGAMLHLDESTPHIAAVVVPIMPAKEGAKNKYRLSGKDMFNPTRLKGLQQRWEDRLTPHGVGPRTKGSKARHTTIKEYYSALEASRAEDPRSKLSVSEPPKRKPFESAAKHDQHVKEWRKAEAKRIRKEMAPIARQAAQARLWDAERRSANELRGRLQDSGVELMATAENLELAKDEIQALRAVPINEVAIALGYTGQIGPRENAIDLVKRAGGLDYKQSLAWLAQRFSPDLAATAAREAALKEAKAAAKARPVLTAAEHVKRDMIGQQLEALAAPAYRITIMTERDGKQIGHNLGKQQDGSPEQTFTAPEVQNLVPKLIAENARGGNVFVTPLDDAVHHALIDDLSADGLQELKRRGYAPAAVMESSPGNFQAVVKVPATLPKENVNEWFKALNKDIGDPRITGLRHPMRLAGFQNRKDKHAEADAGRRPLVQLVEAVNRLCGRAMEVIKAMSETRDAEHRNGPTRSGGRLGPRQ